MKTPIQEVIDFVNDINDNDRSGFDYYYQSIMNKLNELLEKEKEQIIDAYENGVGDENERNLSGQFTNAEEYYNQTYNQNK
jgi:hypothetical protein